MTIITASLLNWVLEPGPIIRGTISNSIDSEYEDGERFIFINVVSFEHYEEMPNNWPDHYLLKTNTDKYFMCLSSEQKNEPMA